LAPANVSIVEGDALELDWPALMESLTPPSSRFPLPVPKLIGNLPYYITAPLIEKALTPPLPRLAVFLVQKEVADRLVASPGSRTYGGLSVGVQSVAQVERLFVVRAGAFHPPPKVDSAVVRLTPLAEPLVRWDARAAFRAFVSGVFGQRRKQLIRSLRDVAGVSREAAAQTLLGLGIDPSARPEVLAPRELVRLHEAVDALTLNSGSH
jgi:16S rRNA (adenine1518-N6/adenine1519-N6)-dimethyltransferase